jgi:hypothetical protein
MPVQALGFGSRSSDSFWPQLHEDTLALLPQAECEGLQAAYSLSGTASSLSTRACTGGNICLCVSSSGEASLITQPSTHTSAPSCAALSHSFRPCAAGNLGAPLLDPSAAPGGGPLQLGLLTSGFSCSSDPSVSSASSPAMYAWMPLYAEWLQKQLADK